MMPGEKGFNCASFAVSLVLVSVVALSAGCATVREDAAPDPPRPRREVFVDEPDIAAAGEAHGVDEAPDEQAARSARASTRDLEEGYERALRLLERGEVRAAKVMMVALRSQAQKADVDLPDGFEDDFQRIIAEVTEEPQPDPEPDKELLELLREPARHDLEGPSLPAEADLPEEETGHAESEPEVQYSLPEFSLPGLLDPELADEEIVLDFNQVDIRIVLETISDITGANFLVDDAVSGTVTLISSSEVKLSEVFRVLESILEIHGWAALPSDNVIKVLPKGEGVRRRVPTRIGKDPAEIPRDDSFATQVIRLDHIDVKEAVPLVEPRMSAQGNLSAHEPSNTIFVTDISSSIYQVALMVSQIDIPRERGELVVLPLRYASARTVAEKINALIDLEEMDRFHRNGELKILPDARTNSIVALAVRPVIESIKNLIEHLDVPRPEESVNVHVIKLFNADAQDLVDSLSTTVDALTDHEDAEPVHITADVPTNSLIIAASPQDFQVLRAIIEDLDIVREQVLVELRIMEASQRALREIGFDWTTMDAPSDDSIRGIGGTDLGVRSDIRGLGPPGLRLAEPGGMAAALVKGEMVGAMLRALEASTDVDVLSTPHILTSNHQKASISVVENIPFVRETRIVTQEDRDEIRTWDYRDVGIKLEITPHVGAGGMVRMLIGSEFSKVVEEGEGRLRTSKREAETTVGVQSGETVVIGGLIQDDKVSVTKQVPLLGSIPVLGHLFRTKSDEVEKTNLLIFITPHVLTDRKELADMSERKEQEVQESRASGDDEK